MMVMTVTSQDPCLVEQVLSENMYDEDLAIVELLQLMALEEGMRECYVILTTIMTLPCVVCRVPS